MSHSRLLSEGLPAQEAYLVEDRWMLGDGQGHWMNDEIENWMNDEIYKWMNEAIGKWMNKEIDNWKNKV